MQMLLLVQGLQYQAENIVVLINVYKFSCVRAVSIYWNECSGVFVGREGRIEVFVSLLYMYFSCREGYFVCFMVCCNNYQCIFVFFGKVQGCINCFIEVFYFFYDVIVIVCVIVLVNL